MQTITKHFATIDGKTFTRNSERHTYTHAIVARRWNKINAEIIYAKATPYMRRGPSHSWKVNSIDQSAGKGEWVVLGWAGSEKLAMSRVITEAKNPNFADVIAIPAQVEA